MKNLCLATVLMIAGSFAAHADESSSFQVDGRNIRVDRPAGCMDLSCISVSIPGVYGSKPRREKQSETQNRKPVSSVKGSGPKAQQQATQPASRTPADTDKPAVDTARAAKPAETLKEPIGAPSPSPTVTAPSQTSSPAPAAAPSSPEMPAKDDDTRKNAGEPAKQPAAPATTPVRVQHAAVPANSETRQISANDESAGAASTPIGTWQTEKGEGQIRIENCGDNLCGYEFNTKAASNGRKILIDMRPDGDVWTGQIFDPKSGSRYDSTIALKGQDRLRVQGCALGGLFCGGQTWSRLN